MDKQPEILESIVEKFPTYLSCSYGAIQDGKSFLYFGEIINIYCDGSDVEAMYRLTKFEKIKNPMKILGIQIQPSKKKIWSYDTDYDHYKVLSGYKSDLLHWGVVNDILNNDPKDLQYTHYARGKLFNNALNSGIKLEHELFDRVFGENENIIKAIYIKRKELSQLLKRKLPE